MFAKMDNPFFEINNAFIAQDKGNLLHKDTAKINVCKRVIIKLHYKSYKKFNLILFL